MVRTPTITAMLGRNGVRFVLRGGGGEREWRERGEEASAEEFDGFLRASSAIREVAKDEISRTQNRKEESKEPISGFWELGLLKKKKKKKREI